MSESTSLQRKVKIDNPVEINFDQLGDATIRICRALKEKVDFQSNELVLLRSAFDAVHKSLLAARYGYLLADEGHDLAVYVESHGHEADQSVIVYLKCMLALVSVGREKAEEVYRTFVDVHSQMNLKEEDTFTLFSKCIDEFRTWWNFISLEEDALQIRISVQYKFYLEKSNLYSALRNIFIRNKWEDLKDKFFRHFNNLSNMMKQYEGYLDSPELTSMDQAQAEMQSLMSSITLLTDADDKCNEIPPIQHGPPLSLLVPVLTAETTGSPVHERPPDIVPPHSVNLEQIRLTQDQASSISQHSTEGDYSNSTPPEQLPVTTELTATPLPPMKISPAISTKRSQRSNEDEFYTYPFHPIPQLESPQQTQLTHDSSPIDIHANRDSQENPPSPVPAPNSATSTISPILPSPVTSLKRNPSSVSQLADNDRNSTSQKQPFVDAQDSNHIFPDNLRSQMPTPGSIEESNAYGPTPPATNPTEILQSEHKSEPPISTDKATNNTDGRQDPQPPAPKPASSKSKDSGCCCCSIQ